MTDKTITDQASLKNYLSTNNMFSSDKGPASLEDFVATTKFEGNQLTGMRYDKLITAVSINEFLDFLDASGIPRKAFTEPKIQDSGCGKDYEGSQGNCTYSPGNYCYCGDQM